MKRPRILIAFDGSPNSQDALALGKRMCHTLEADPLVVSCVRFPRYLIDPEDLEVSLSLDESPKLTEAAEFLAPLEAVTRTVVDDSPAKALQKIAEREEVIAVVVGSSHHGGFGSVLLGSVGRKLVGGSPCPVAIAPRDFRNRTNGIERVCVAVDEGEESQHALDEAIALASRAGATLTVVSVLGQAVFATIPVADLEKVETAQRRFTAELLEKAASRIPSEVSAEIKRLEGNPAVALAEYSARFDLMIVGSRGYGPLRTVLLGSVSGQLARTAKCPLVIVPRDPDRSEVRFAEVERVPAASNETARR